MNYDNLFLSMVFNIGFLVLIANLMSRTRLIKGLIYGRESSLGAQLALAAFFGVISILSTYTGTGVNGAIVNTRVIGVLSAGLLGGPVAGVGAALIGGMHRWLFDVGGFTAVACACSTGLEGVLGCFFHRRFQEGRLKGWRLMALAAGAEVCQMVVILLIAKPFGAAVELVKVIALPMILMNSLGIVAFIGAFNHVFVEQSTLADSRIRLALKIAEQCLPYLRKGLYSKKDLDAAVGIIHRLSGCAGIAVTDGERVLSHSEESPLDPGLLDPLPDMVRQAMAGLATQVRDGALPEDSPAMAELFRQYVMIASPMAQHGRAIGCLVLVEKKKWLSLEAQVGFLEGLAMLFSTQLELSQLEYQKKLLQRAEFQMLQAQVNPHFLFNSLNTISCFCREKPERARELLRMLGDYYRYATDRGEVFVELSGEVRQVKTYLLLEQARFEEKLTLCLDTGEAEAPGCLVPSLILQPIVENAVKHGADAQGRRSVTVSVRRDQSGVAVCVADKGRGFPPRVLEGLATGFRPGESVGLVNVHKRLRSIYGEHNGLVVHSTPAGSEVTMFFPALAEGEAGREVPA